MVQVKEMLDQAYFDADEYEAEGWVDQLKYEWEILDELEARQKLKEDETLRQVGPTCPPASYAASCTSACLSSPCAMPSNPLCLREALPPGSGAAQSALQHRS